jgi:hypothetical protein
LHLRGFAPRTSLKEIRLVTDEIFAAIRERCPTGAWSKGVTLARHGAVSLESVGDDEIQGRVAIPGSPLTPSITLFLEDQEWECDCDSPLDACEHVAAVIIAWRQGTGQKSEARPIEYRLRSTREGIYFERGVSEGTDFLVIDVPLDGLASGQFQGPQFTATPEDLAVELALQGTIRGLLERGVVKQVLHGLSRVDRVTLDGRPVKVAADPVLPSVRVEDVPEGIRLCLRPEDDVSKRFVGGVLLADGVLRPEGEPPLSGKERHELTRGRVYRWEELGELVGTVLPSLEKRLPLDIRTERLPSTVRERPRLSLLLKRDGDNLYVLPGIIYGDPPKARIEGERLVSLGGAVPFRDIEAERAVEERLASELGLKTGRGVELETAQAIEFVRTLRGFEGHLEGDGREFFRSFPELNPRLSVLDSDFEVRFESGGRGADPKAVLRAWHSGSSLVPLADGGFAPLPLDWLDRYGDRLSDLLAAREARGKLPPSSLPDLARLCADLDTPPPPAFEGLRSLVEELDALPDAALPQTLVSKLRDYQRVGVNWLVFLKRAGLGALLADDMGLGKTLQALCALEGRSLVVAPTSVLRNWMDEAERFRPELSLCLYHGLRRELDEKANLTITSHALLRQDREKLSAVDWDTVVIDEAQAIRNPETDLARAAFALRARFRLSLTGTPIENRLNDLWSQLHFLNPGLLGGLSDFGRRYVRPIENGELEPLERLRERLRPFFFRRLKREVAPELPPRTETTLWSELSEPEQAVYEAVRLAARREVLAKLEAKGNVLAALEALLRLRQAACHPALVPGQEATTSSKTELLLDSLETASAEGHKSLVFSQWTSMLDLLEPNMKDRDLAFLRLDGSTRDRGAVVRRFQEDEATSVFLISLKAGGTGLNLTAADHVFLFDPWWNPAVEEQAFDRAHRIGQDKPVFVHRLVASGTVEERILALQDEKKSLAEMATGGAPTGLTREDLLRLIE